MEWNSSKIGADGGVSSNTDSSNVNGTCAISKKKRSMSHEILKRSMTEEPLEKTVCWNSRQSLLQFIRCQTTHLSQRAHEGESFRSFDSITGLHQAHDLVRTISEHHDLQSNSLKPYIPFKEAFTTRKLIYELPTIQKCCQRLPALLLIRDF